MGIDGIVEGYSNLIKRDEEIEKLAKQRLSVCEDCPFNSKNNSMLGSMIPYCTKCGCILAAKVRNEKGQCPEKKW